MARPFRPEVNRFLKICLKVELAPIVNTFNCTFGRRPFTGTSFNHALDFKEKLNSSDYDLGMNGKSRKVSLGRLVAHKFAAGNNFLDREYMEFAVSTVCKTFQFMKLRELIALSLGPQYWE